MFELKRLSPEGIERALEKVERYRLLNEPWEAESISRDVLEVDPGNEEARIQLLLSLTDQFGQEGGPGVEDAETVLEALDGEYERAYYAGIICERKGTTYLKRGALGSGETRTPSSAGTPAPGSSWATTTYARRPGTGR